MKRLLFIFVVALLSVIAASCVWLRIDAAEYVDETLAERVNSLMLIEKILDAELTPTGSDLAAGFSEKGVDQALSSLVGISATSDKVGGIEISVSEAEVNIVPGESSLVLRLSAKSLDKDLSVSLTTTSYLTMSAADATSVTFKLVVRKVDVDLDLGFFSVRTRKWVSDLLASHVAREFSEALTVPIPLSFPASFPVGFEKDETYETDTGGEPIGSYTARVSLANHEFFSRDRLVVSPPIAVDGGLWVLASVLPPDNELEGNVVEYKTIVVDGFRARVVTRRVKRDTPASTDSEFDAASGDVLYNAISKPLAVDSSAMDKDELLTEHRRLLDAIEEKTGEFIPIEGDVNIRLNAGLFERFIGEWNAIPDDKRAVKWQLTEAKGHIAKKMEDVDVVGEGGFYANFQNNNAAHATVLTGPMTETWTETGLQLSTLARANGRADLTLHVDPYIGGGFDIDLGVDISGSTQINALLDFRVIEDDEGERALVSGVAIGCAVLPIEYLGGGEIEFGARLHEMIGDSQSDPNVMIWSKDERWNNVFEGSNNDSMKMSEYWSVNKLDPINSGASQEGYLLVAAVSARLHEGEQPELPKDDEAIKIIAEHWKALVQTDCPTPPPDKFLFAGDDFGPNNEIVKALAVIYEKAMKTYGSVKITTDGVIEVLKQPDRLDDVLKREWDRTRNNAETTIKRATDPDCIARLFHDCD